MIPCGYISDCSTLSRIFSLPSVPVNYNGLCMLTSTLCPPSSLLVYLTWAVALNTECTVSQLDCPHEASLKVWHCKMAANWEWRHSSYAYENHAKGSKTTLIYCTVSIHLYWCIYRQYNNLLQIQKSDMPKFTCCTFKSNTSAVLAVIKRIHQWLNSHSIKKNDCKQTEGRSFFEMMPQTCSNSEGWWQLDESFSLCQWSLLAAIPEPNHVQTHRKCGGNGHLRSIF